MFMTKKGTTTEDAIEEWYRASFYLTDKLGKSLEDILKKGKYNVKRNIT